MKCAAIVLSLTMNALLSMAFAAAQAGGSAEPEFLTSEEMQELNLPFSEAVRVGNLLFLSGAVGTRPGTMELVEGGLQAETKQALQNISTILRRHGSSLERVVKCTVMMVDMSEWPAMNEVYRTFFSRHYPARSALGASGLALGARVEIECIAVADPAAPGR